MRWFEIVQQRTISVSNRRLGRIDEETRTKGRPKLNSVEEEIKDMLVANVTKGLALNKFKWRKMIHVVEP